MNVNSILEKAELFNALVVKSGFSRNLNDYISFINQNKTIVSFSDIVKKVIQQFEEFENNSLAEELSLILKQNKPFIEDKKILNELNSLLNDNEIDMNSYFSKLHGILNKLKTSLEKNISEINTIISNFSSYQSQPLSYEQKDENVVLSLVFNDLKSTSTIKGFNNVLRKWDKTLRLYHQLLKSDAPAEIELESIQNGCIEVIFNFNFDLALSLTNVVTHGMDLLFGYFLMKESKPKISKFMTKTKRLRELEKQEEKVFLEDLNEELYLFILDEHKKAKENNSSINNESIEKKAKEVVNVIYEHIVNGNKLKLLTKIEIENKDEVTEEIIMVDKQEALRQDTAKLQEKLKNNKDEVKLLLEHLNLHENQEY